MQKIISSGIEQNNVWCSHIEKSMPKRKAKMQETPTDAAIFTWHPETLKPVKLKCFDMPPV